MLLCVCFIIIIIILAINIDSTGLSLVKYYIKKLLRPKVNIVLFCILDMAYHWFAICFITAVRINNKGNEKATHISVPGMCAIPLQTLKQCKVEDDGAVFTSPVIFIESFYFRQFLVSHIFVQHFDNYHSYVNQSFSSILPSPLSCNCSIHSLQAMFAVSFAICIHIDFSAHLSLQPYITIEWSQLTLQSHWHLIDHTILLVQQFVALLWSAPVALLEWHHDFL